MELWIETKRLLRLNSQYQISLLIILVGCEFPDILPLSCLIPPPQITKFQAVSQIPARFIERNVSLRGKVHAITERGVQVEHVPIYLPVLSALLSKHKGNEWWFVLWVKSWRHAHTCEKHLVCLPTQKITYWESESCYTKSCNFSLCCMWSSFPNWE